MNKEWSKSWKSSKLPRKQRKYVANAPLHVKHRLLGTHLSKDLRQKYGTRSAVVRSGDKVKIMRGKFRGSSGSIDRVDSDRACVYVTGIEIVKRDGSKVMPPIRASNVMITDLNLSDKKRQMKLNKLKESKDSKAKNK